MKLGVNNKGEACDIKPITCQEGYCEGCQIYLDYRGYLRTMGNKSISSSIYPIDLLGKQICVKRNESFNETCYGSREHKLQAQAMVNAYDVVLELIDKGGK